MTPQVPTSLHELPAWVDVTAVSVGPVFGAHTARGRHVPLFAVLLAGLVAGLGGGIARDVLLGIGPGPRRPDRAVGPWAERLAALEAKFHRTVANGRAEASLRAYAFGLNRLRHLADWPPARERAFPGHDSAQLGVALMTRKLLINGMKPPVTPISAGIEIWRAPARPWICWMVSVWPHQRVRPLPMFPPLGDTGLGPEMLMSVLKKSRASPCFSPAKPSPSMWKTWKRLNPSYMFSKVMSEALIPAASRILRPVEAELASASSSVSMVPRDLTPL